MAHEYLSSGNITITQPGYVYIYLSNESASQVEVYFDDFKVTHTMSPVIQSDSYYPFGARFDSYTRENSLFNKRLYNAGSELQTDLDLGTYMTDLRMYDPWGRLGWWSIDPLADQAGQESWSPYNYSFNNPVRYNDPKGDCPTCLLGAVVGAAVEYGTQVATNLIRGDNFADAAFNNVDFVDVAVSAGEGAITQGASAGRKLLISAGTEIVKASIDGFGSGKTDVAGTEGSSKTLAGVATDAAAGVISNKLGDKGGKALVDNSSAKALKSATSDVNAATKNLQKSINTVSNGNLNSKAASTTTSYSNLNKAKSSLQTTKVLNQTVGKVNGQVVQGTTDVATGAASNKVTDEIKKN